MIDLPLTMVAACAGMLTNQPDKLVVTHTDEDGRIWQARRIPFGFQFICVPTATTVEPPGVDDAPLPFP